MLYVTIPFQLTFSNDRVCLALTEIREESKLSTACTNLEIIIH